MHKFFQIKHLVLLILFVTGTYGQQNIIRSLDIQIKGENLFVTPHLNDFINEDLHSMINSGLSVSLQFYFELIAANGKNIEKKEETVVIKNDVWEKYYQIKIDEISKNIRLYDKFRKFLFDSLQFKIVTVNRISNDEKLQVIFSFSTENISSSQEEKLEYWLSDDSQFNMNEDKESSFSVNVSKLISFFLSSNKSKTIHVFKSKIFTKQSVKYDAQTSK